MLTFLSLSISPFALLVIFNIRPILLPTKYMLFRRQDTKLLRK